MVVLLICNYKLINVSHLTKVMHCCLVDITTREKKIDKPIFLVNLVKSIFLHNTQGGSVCLGRGGGHGS